MAAVGLKPGPDLLSATRVDGRFAFLVAGGKPAKVDIELHALVWIPAHSRHYGRVARIALGIRHEFPDRFRELP